MGDVQDERFDWWAHIPGAAKSTLIGGLLLAAFGNVGVINTYQRTDDRFKGEDFRREIAVRDEVIAENRRDIARLRDELRESERARHKHEEHSAKYTQIIVQLAKAMDMHMEGHQ